MKKEENNPLETLKLLIWAYSEGYNDSLEDITPTPTSLLDFKNELFKQCGKWEEEVKKDPSLKKSPWEEVVDIAMWSFQYGSKSKAEEIKKFQPDLTTLPRKISEHFSNQNQNDGTKKEK